MEHIYACNEKKVQFWLYSPRFRLTYVDIFQFLSKGSIEGALELKLPRVLTLPSSESLILSLLLHLSAINAAHRRWKSSSWEAYCYASAASAEVVSL